LSEFLIKYLKKRYSSDQSAFEHSYALSDVFENNLHQNNEYFQQFTAILNGKVNPNLVISLLRLFSELKFF